MGQLGQRRVRDVFLVALSLRRAERANGPSALRCPRSRKTLPLPRSSCCLAFFIGTEVLLQRVALENVFNVAGAVQHADNFSRGRQRTIENDVAAEGKALQSRS